MGAKPIWSGAKPQTVRPVYPDRSDRSQQRPAQVRPLHQEYRVKEKKDEPEPMQVDSGKAPVDNVVQVEDGKDKIQDAQKGPMIIEESVDASQKVVLANDYEASSSNSKDQGKEKYFQPRWCPPGLTLCGMRSWWIMRLLWNTQTWKSMLCAFLMITGRFRRRRRHI